MKRKSMLQLGALAFAVCAMVVFVACSGGKLSHGFSSQTSLAKAYLNVESKFWFAMSYGEGLSFEDIMKFDYETKFVGELGAKGVRESTDAMIKKAKETHKAKMNGSWVVDYNDNGTVKSRYKDEANKALWDAYKNQYNVAKKEVNSYKYVSTKKNDVATKDAVQNAGAGLATAVEVWEITFEYQEYKIENNAVVVDGEKKTGQKTFVTMHKIGSKWYADLDGLFGGY